MDKNLIVIGEGVREILRLLPRQSKQIHPLQCQS